MKRNPSILALVLTWLLWSFGAAAWAVPWALMPPAPPAEKELIVLLSADPGAPKAEDVVGRSRRGLALPDNFAVGNPKEARYMLGQRAADDLLAEIEADPDSPRARLERYIVLRYPADANLEAIRRALLRNPYVLAAEENRLVDLAVTVPNDPMFPTTGSTPPTQYQWGSYTLHLPDAWDYTKGHAWVGTVDTGIDTTHPELAPFNTSNSYQGGNFRAHLSYDFGYSDGNVDEKQPQLYNGQTTTPQAGGHGTHVAGIIAAVANNGTGVAGACWGCSLMIGKGSTLMASTCPSGTGTCTYNASLSEANAAAALAGLVDRGAQVVNMSFRTTRRDCSTLTGNALCSAVAYATSRDVSMVASAGNGGADVGFPAQDSRVLGVGGINPDGSFWGTCNTATDTPDCPSNSGPDQDVVAPARQVLSTFYRNLPYLTNCSESTAGSGYGPCTGTSMSSPYVSGVAGLVRSANPLLSSYDVLTLVRSTASFGTFHDNQMGYGVVNALAAVQAALGKVNGAVLPNRLTPLFSFYSSTRVDTFYTTAPQMATAAEMLGYGPYGSNVPAYTAFPGAPACSGCRVAPGASVYIFTGDRAPYAGAPPLVPLYRMTYFAPSGSHRDTTYTTEVNGINTFHSVGYELDGIEGYIYQRCTPEPQCIPPGAVRLYRYYNASMDDWAIFPESELSQAQANGYTAQAGANPWIGYVYPNVDTDNDGLIDGFEGLIGTNPQVADTDCDGTNDGSELLRYPYSDPRGASQCDQPPVARFTTSCAGKTCSFDSSTSTDDLGVASRSWSFGDGGTATGVTASHTYATAGTFTALLTVIDTTGHSNQTSHTVTTTADDPPYASFYVGCSNLTCSADSESSGDDFGIVNYTWTWGDGQTTTGGSSVSAPNHTYAAAGTYTITLVVKDASNQTSTDSHSVTVSAGPTASFTITCTGRSCSTNASASTGGIVSYYWDWDDESSTTTAGPTASHNYPYDSTFTVHLTVTDANGNSAATSRVITLGSL